MHPRALLAATRAARLAVLPARRHFMPAIAAGARRRAEWAAPRSVLPFMMRGFSAAADGGAGGEEGGAGVAPAAGQEAEVVENSADVESAAAASELGADEAEVEQVEAKASVGLSEADSLAATFGKGPRPGLDDGEGGWTEDETVPVVHNSYPGVKLPPTRTGKDWQAQLHFKAFDANVIDYASAYVRHIAAVLGVRTGNVVPLPKKTKLFTVLRSPHVHKKSREQFHMMTYKRLICIYDSAPENLDVFYEELQARPPVGVLIKIKDRRKIEMPVAAP